MKRFFVIATVLLLFYACKPGVPKDIIQPEEMEKVLYDMHLVEGYVSNLPTPDTSKKVSAAFYKGVYKKFGIDSVLYNKSLNYYYTNPVLMKNMYDHITAKLAAAREKQAKQDEKRLKLVQ